MTLTRWPIRNNVFIVGLFTVMKLIYVVAMRETNAKENNSVKQIGDEPKNPALKYILEWTPALYYPFEDMGFGQQVFISRKCPHTNCFVTEDRNYFKDYTKFDVIAFNGRQLHNYFKSELPRMRSPHQKYVFVSYESPSYYPLCQKYFDGFFNWTWTYKTESDSRLEYLAIRDMKGNVIGPNKVMHWMKHEDMLPASDELKRMLRRKNKTAAWFVSNCKAKNNREDFVAQLRLELLSNYGLIIDVYGKCGRLNCTVCDQMIQEDYLFYLSFENSFSEDYVTEKLSRALENYAVPIVYGGANYSRFMPTGAYLDARKLGVKKLAAKIYELVNDFDQYADYFRWTNYYKYHRRDAEIDTDSYCALCAMLNDEKKVKQVSIYKNFRKWWNNVGSCKIFFN